jgi:hypothetical protein
MLDPKNIQNPVVERLSSAIAAQSESLYAWMSKVEWEEKCRTSCKVPCKNLKILFTAFQWVIEG